MGLEKAVAVVVLGWLIGALLVMAWSVQRGRKLTAKLATRHPEIYEALGRPRPGYLHSVRRNRFAQFVGRREFENLADPELAAQFDEYRKSAARVLLFVLASLVVVALLVFAARHAA